MAPLGEKDTGGGAHMSDTNDKIRIVQETVAGKEITFAKLIYSQNIFRLRNMRK